MATDTEADSPQADQLDALLALLAEGDHAAADALPALMGGGAQTFSADDDTDPAPLAPEAADLAAAVEYMEQCRADGVDPAAGLNALYQLLADPDAVDDAVGDVQTFSANWDPLLHPKGKDGRFLPKDAIQEAKGDPEKAKALREKVRPEDKDKLEDALSGKTDTGRTKRGQQKHDTATKRQAIKASRDEAKRLAYKLTHDPSPEDYHDLIPHLPALSAKELSHVRLMLGASFGGSRAVAERRAKLVEYARNAAFDARLQEQGIEGEEAEDMRRAAGIAPKVRKEKAPPANPTADEIDAAPKRTNEPPHERVHAAINDLVEKQIAGAEYRKADPTHVPGAVYIPRLRDELKTRHPDLTDAQVDEALLQLRRDDRARLIAPDNGLGHDPADLKRGVKAVGENFIHAELPGAWGRWADAASKRTNEPASPPDRAKAAAKAHAELLAKHKPDFDRYNALPEGKARDALGKKLDALDPQFAATKAELDAAHRALAEHNGHEYAVHVARPGQEPQIVSRHTTLKEAANAHVTAEQQELRDASKVRSGIDIADEYGQPGGAWHTRASDGREVYVAKVSVKKKGEPVDGKTFSFDPNEKRAADGKWTSGGGSGTSGGMGDTEPDEPDDAPAPTRPGSLDPINDTDPEKVKLLAARMETHGWEGPPLVAMNDQAFAGSHRLKAAELAGLNHIPVIHLTDEQIARGLKSEGVSDVSELRLPSEDDMYRFVKASGNEAAEKVMEEEIDKGYNYGGEKWRRADWAKKPTEPLGDD